MDKEIDEIERMIADEHYPVIKSHFEYKEATENKQWHLGSEMPQKYREIIVIKLHNDEKITFLTKRIEENYDMKKWICWTYVDDILKTLPEEK